MTTRHLPTDHDAAAAILRSQREILDDIADGTVPSSVASFGELHDYVDANMYGGLCDEDGPVEWLPEDDDDLDAALALSNHVQEVVHQWLVAGRPERVDLHIPATQILEGDVVAMGFLPANTHYVESVGRDTVGGRDFVTYEARNGRGDKIDAHVLPEQKLDVRRWIVIPQHADPAYLIERNGS